MEPVKEISPNPLKLKERMKIPRQHMPEQEATLRLRISRK